MRKSRGRHIEKEMFSSRASGEPEERILYVFSRWISSEDGSTSVRTRDGVIAGSPRLKRHAKGTSLTA